MEQVYIRSNKDLLKSRFFCYKPLDIYIYIYYNTFVRNGKCGKKLDSGSKFCVNCGNSVGNGNVKKNISNQKLNKVGHSEQNIKLV